MNELYKKRPGTSQMSEHLDRTSLQVHSRISSPYDWSTRSELYPEVITAQPGQRGKTRSTHTQKEHTLGNGDTTQRPARDSEGELVVAAAAPPPPPPPPLLLLLCCCCCCCCAAAVLLLCCWCFTTRDASRSTSRLNRLFLVLCFLERTQERVTAQQQQQQQ